MSEKVTELKARMFDLQQRADMMQKRFTESLKPIREEFDKLASELLGEDKKAKAAVAEAGRKEGDKKKEEE